MKSILWSAAVMSTLLIGTGTAHAVTVGEIDTFSAGIEGWFAGGGPVGQIPSLPPAVVPTGGPGGAGDSFMLISANGSAAAGGRLVALICELFAGIYAAAGISSIAMDLRNLGNSDLNVRLYFEDPIPGPPVNEAVTTASVLLPAGGTWTHAVFSIAPGSLTALQGSASTVLSNTTILRIFSGAAADFPPERIAGQLGVDNIQAIPEPETYALLAAGLAFLAWRTGRRSRAKSAS
jgi:hypothetical protein